MKIIVVVSANPIDVCYTADMPDVKCYRAAPDSYFARSVGAKDQQVFSLEYVGGEDWRVMRRTNYPYSHNQLIGLLSDYGSGSAAGVTDVNQRIKMPLPSGQNTSFGSPIGSGVLNLNFNLPLLLLLAIVAVILLTETKTE